MEKALDIVHNDYPSHPTGDLSWFFTVKTCLGFWRRNRWTCEGLPKTAALSSLTHASTHLVSSSSSKLPFECYKFMASLASAPGK